MDEWVGLGWVGGWRLAWVLDSGTNTLNGLIGWFKAFFTETEG